MPRAGKTSKRNPSQTPPPELAKEFYRTLFEHSGTAVAVIDKSGLLVDVNRRFEKMSGYKRTEIVARMRSSDFNKDPRQDLLYHRQRRKNRRLAPTHYEGVFVTKAGRERMVDISVDLIPGTQKSLVSLIDVTDQRQLGQAMHRQEQELANITQNSIDGILSFDKQKNIRSWNRGAQQIFQYMSAEIIGRPFATLLTPDCVKNRKLEKTLAKLQQEGFVKNVACTLLRKDGQEILTEMSLTAIKDAQENHSGTSIVARDVTQQKEMEKSLVQLEKMSILGQLSASLTHEIKNPLNSIVINLEVLKNALHESAANNRQSLEKYVKVISSEVFRLNKVLQGFLEFAHPAGDHFCQQNLSRVVRKVIELVSIQAKMAQVEIEFKPAKKAINILGEENQLRQIFLNLVLNSLEAMPDGGKIWIGCQRDRAGKVHCLVQDNGSGIQDQHLDQVFDLYFSTKEKGSGIGLALVKRLVEHHGGKISLQSESDRGTRIEVIFPSLKESQSWKKKSASW